MSCVIPTARDVRHYLEGYCLEQQDMTTYTVTFLSGATTITLPGDITALRPYMGLSGSGISTGTVISSIDYVTNVITISIATQSDQTNVSLVVTYNTDLSDDWIIRRRDNVVIPWIQKRTALNITGTRQITEYLSGNGLETLILTYRPVISLDEISYVNEPEEFYDNIAQSVEVDTDQGILISRWRVTDAADRTVFSRGTKNIRVKYTVGYSDIAAEAPDVCEAITMWIASKALTLIASRTGGGNINLPGYNRSFGRRGKYSEIIMDLEQGSMAILSNYFIRTGGP